MARKIQSNPRLLFQELYQQTMNSLQEMLQSLLLENPRPSELKTMLEVGRGGGKGVRGAVLHVWGMV